MTPYLLTLLAFAAVYFVLAVIKAASDLIAHWRRPLGEEEL